MSERDWLRNAPALVGLSLTALFVGMGWTAHIEAFHSDERPKEQHEKGRSASQQDAVSGEDAPRLGSESSTDLSADGNQNDIRRQPEQHPNESALLGDRFAQGLMAILTVPALLIAGLTLALVYGTFSQTQAAARWAKLTFQQARRQTNDARDIGRKQVRAYVSIGDGHFKLNDFSIGESQEAVPHVTLKIDVRNSGQSVAQNMTIAYQGMLKFEGETRSEFSNKTACIDISANDTEPVEHSIPYPWDIGAPANELFEHQLLEFILFVTVTGTDVFDRALPKTFRAYYFGKEDFALSGWNKLRRQSWRPDGEPKP